mmetsp:Transcript_104740/g.305818  ORF Transcript_104740/g.305818 Transcript_104740/m.305818 type:complete len:346 (-) Transcript_104740:894-1931(-)
MGAEDAVADDVHPFKDAADGVDNFRRLWVRQDLFALAPQQLHVHHQLLEVPALGCCGHVDEQRPGTHGARSAMQVFVDGVPRAIGEPVVAEKLVVCPIEQANLPDLVVGLALGGRGGGEAVGELEGVAVPVELYEFAQVRHLFDLLCGALYEDVVVHPGFKPAVDQADVQPHAGRALRADVRRRFEETLRHAELQAPHGGGIRVVVVELVEVPQECTHSEGEGDHVLDADHHRRLQRPAPERAHVGDVAVLVQAAATSATSLAWGGDHGVLPEVVGVRVLADVDRRGVERPEPALAANRFFRILPEEAEWHLVFRQLVEAHVVLRAAGQGHDVEAAEQGLPVARA